MLDSYSKIWTWASQKKHKKQEETLYHDHVCAYTCTNIKVERYPILCRGIFGKGSPVFVVNTGLNFIRIIPPISHRVF